MRGWSAARRARPRRLRLNLKGMLLCLLLPGMLGSLAFDRYNDYQTLLDVTHAAYDGALRVPMNVLARAVHLEADGELDVDTASIAYRVIGASQTPVHYLIRRLAADPREDPAAALAGASTLAGRGDLPAPASWEQAGAPDMLFYDGRLEGEPMRVAAQVLRVATPQGPAHVLVQAAQSSDERLLAEDRAWRQETWRDVRVVGVMALLLWLGVSWGLRPLSRLRAEVAARAPDDATPLDTEAVPGEVAPLVEAVNHHIARHQAMVDAQSRFLADASHQLRTPLTVMLTQAEYGLRETDPARMRDSLRALIERLIGTRRLTVQLLNLALATHAGEEPRAPFDLAAVGRDVLIEYLPLAEERRLDLGWEGEGDWPVLAMGHADGIREAISNLVHNALAYTPPGGRVTLSCGRETGRAWLAVSDDGPGIPLEQRDAAFERFERLGANRSGVGAGLGLAIAQAFVQRDNGQIALLDGEPNSHGGCGLRATISLPASDAALQHKS